MALVRLTRVRGYRQPVEGLYSSAHVSLPGFLDQSQVGENLYVVRDEADPKLPVEHLVNCFSGERHL